MTSGVTVFGGKRAELVFTLVTPILANQHIALASEMCVNVYVICAKVQPGLRLSIWVFRFLPRVSRTTFIAIRPLYWQFSDGLTI